MPEVKVIQPTKSISQKKIRLAAYCRVSSSSEDQLNSFVAQMLHYKQFAQSNNNLYELVDIYADEGITGTSASKRQELQRMLMDCRSGRIDKVIVKSISRLARNTSECLEIIRELKQLHIGILFEKENIDTAKVLDETIVTLLGSFAQEESISISRNVKIGNRYRMENGTYKNGRAPYGYRFIGDQLVIEESEAEVVRRIFSEYLSGKGISRIAAILNEEGTDKSKINWTHSVISYILKNEKYIGDCLWNKTFTSETLPFRKKRNDGQVDRFYIVNTHEPIISREDYNTVQTMLANEPFILQEKQQYLFAKKIKCGVCGRRYERKTTNHKHYWVCSNYSSTYHECKGSRVPEEKLCQAFVHMYNKLLQNKEEILTVAIHQLCALKSLLLKGNPQIRDIDKEIAALTQESYLYTQMKTNGILDEIVYMEQFDKIEKCVNELRGRRNRILAGDAEEQEIECLRRIKKVLDENPEMLQEFDEMLFTEMVDYMEVQKDKTLIFYLYGGLQLKEKMP